MRKRHLVVLLCLVAGLTVGVGLALAGQAGGRVVKTPGGEVFKVNQEVADTRHFAPAAITVTSGESVTFEKTDKGPDPHTITIATKAMLPRSFESPCKPCQIALGHLKNPKDPEHSPVKTYVLDKGQPGLDTVGDSLALAPKGPHKQITAVVSAPAGTILYYMCAIHPWMQGEIIVK